MPSRLAKLFLSILLTAAFLLPSLASAFHHCEHAAAKVEQTKNDAKDSHEKDCHCPSHLTGCCHPGVYLAKACGPTLLAKLDTISFAEFMDIYTPSPVLDGPFQPPRA